jgi:hypothetical protein
MPILKIKYLLIAAIIFMGIGTSYSQIVGVPIDVQIELLPKILSLNKSFDLDNPDTKINIGILYSSLLRNSTEVKNEIFDNAPNNEIMIKKTKAILIPIDIAKFANIESHLIKNNITVLYFTPLRGYDVSQISKICKEEKIISFTSVSEYTKDEDVSVGFQLDGKKLKIIINLESAKSEGANFSSHLLKISNIE